MATVTNYPIDLPILVIEAQIFVAVNKFQFLPNKLIPNALSNISSVQGKHYSNIYKETHNFKYFLHIFTI